MLENSQVATNLVGGAIAVTILFMAFVRIVDVFNRRAQKQVYTGVAVTNGFLFQLGFSPLGAVSKELTTLIPVLTPNFSQTVQILIGLATFFNLLFGVFFLYDRGGWFGVSAFFVGLLGGAVILVAPVQGILLVILGSLFAEAGETSMW